MKIFSLCRSYRRCTQGTPGAPDRYSKLLVVIFGLLLSILHSLSSPAQALPTFEQSLRAYNIPDVIPDLRNALQDTRPEVRGLVAMELAEKRDKDSIPFIRRALDRAEGSLERQNLAEALIILGDPAGKVAMKEICEDKGSREDLRILAAYRLAEVGSQHCLKPVIEILTSTKDPSVRGGAIEFLRQQEIPNDLKPKLTTGLERSLQDEVATNRQAASRLIAFLKLKAAAPALERALNQERDPATHLQMEQDITALERSNR